jgi:hypothetical protein
MVKERRNNRKIGKVRDLAKNVKKAALLRNSIKK